MMNVNKCLSVKNNSYNFLLIVLSGINLTNDIIHDQFDNSKYNLFIYELIQHLRLGHNQGTILSTMVCDCRENSYLRSDA